MLAGKRVSAVIGIGELTEGVGGYAAPQDFETMLQLLYLKFTSQRFDKSVFDSVIGKKKILVSNITANPQQYFNEQIFKILTQNHPRAFNPYDITNLDKAKFEDIQAIYKERFSDASDFTFIFVGNLEPEKVKPQILKYLGGLPSANRREIYKDWGVVPPAGPLEKTFERGADDRSTVSIIYTGAAEYERDELRRLQFLGDLLTIKLVETLREEKSGVYGARASGVLQKIPTGRYQFDIGFSCAPQNVASLVAATNAAIERIQNGEIDEKDIDKVKQARLNKNDEAFKTNGYWLAIIDSSLSQGDKILTLEESRAKTNAISKDDLQRMARKYLKPEQRLQFVLKPEIAAANAGQTKKAN